MLFRLYLIACVCYVVAMKCEALQHENERLRVENQRLRCAFENSEYLNCLVVSACLCFLHAFMTVYRAQAI